MHKISIFYEDEFLAVLNKPAGLSVHPGAGENQYTLVDFLTEHYPNFLDNFQYLERAGIVHRLDKDTSGLIVIAKDEKTKQLLQNQFRKREVKKEYLALVLGEIKPKDGVIHTLISRDPKDRTRMAISHVQFPWDKTEKREAITRYKTEKVFTYQPKGSEEKLKLSLIRIDLKTGRMHQIRAHFQYLGHPLIGDPIYNTKKSKQISEELSLNRQFLHAHKLQFIHPYTHENLTFESQPNFDLNCVLDTLSHANPLDNK